MRYTFTYTATVLPKTRQVIVVFIFFKKVFVAKMDRDIIIIIPIACCWENFSKFVRKVDRSCGYNNIVRFEYTT